MALDDGPHGKRVARRDETEHGVPHRPADVGVEAPVPALEVAVHDDDFCGRVGGDQVGGRGDGGRVRGAQRPPSSTQRPHYRKSRQGAGNGLYTSGREKRRREKRSRYSRVDRSVRREGGKGPAEGGGDAESEVRRGEVPTSLHLALRRHSAWSCRARGGAAGRGQARSQPACSEQRKSVRQRALTPPRSIGAGPRCRGCKHSGEFPPGPGVQSGGEGRGEQLGVDEEAGFGRGRREGGPTRDKGSGVWRREAGKGGREEPGGRRAWSIALHTHYNCISTARIRAKEIAGSAL